MYLHTAYADVGNESPLSCEKSERSDFFERIFV